MNKKLFSILGIIALFAMAFGFAFTPNNVVANASHGKAMTAGCTTYTRNISGDSDSGFGGYWASDTYVSSYEVCPDSEDGYWVNRTDGGDWETFGGTSPSGASTVGAGVTGTFEGTWNGIHIDGTIMALSTDLGTVDFMCDANGVCSNKSSTLAQIFNPGYVADFPDTWIWTYTGGCQGDLWINAASGSSGDITSPVDCPPAPVVAIAEVGGMTCATIYEDLANLVNKEEAQNHLDNNLFCKNRWFPGYFWYWQEHQDQIH